MSNIDLYNACIEERDDLEREIKKVEMMSLTEMNDTYKVPPTEEKREMLLADMHQELDEMFNP